MIPVITYDPRTNMAYVRLSDAAVMASEEVSPGLVLDYDKDGRVIAIEFLDAKSQLPPDVLASSE